MITRVLIADDHPIFRRGLEEVIRADDRLELVAEAEDGAQAMRLIREHKPDVAVLDISMPEADGLDVLGHANRWPDAPAFVILTMYDDEAYFRRAMQLGALGYLLKENAEQDLVNCILAVRLGRRFLSPNVSWTLADTETEIQSGSLSALTPTEVRVLALIAQYKTSREIGELLSISHRTVQNHRANICSKQGLKGANALLQYALKHSQKS